MAQQFRQCISVEDLRAPRCLVRNCNDSIRIWCNTQEEIYVVLDPNYRTILFRPIVSEIQKKGLWTRGVDANRGSKVSIIDYVFAGLERGPCAVINLWNDARLFDDTDNRSLSLVTSIRVT